MNLRSAAKLKLAHTGTSPWCPAARRASLCLLVSGVLLCEIVSQAATLTWDVNGAAGITDGTGTWTTGTPWTSNGGASNVAWNSGTPDTAVIGGGTLGSAGTITVGTVTLGGITFNTPNGGGTYTLQSGAITLNNATTTFTANANVTIASTVTITTPNGNPSRDLILTGTATSALIDGVVSDGNKNLSVDKQGAGTWVLSGADSFRGSTTVEAGTLKIGGGGAFTQTSDVTVSGGTFLLGSSAGDQVNNAATVTLSGGTIQLGTSGMSESVGALTLSATSTIDFGTLASGGILKFADSSGATWGAFTLNVWNWTQGSDHLFFGSVTNGGLPAGGLAKIHFYSGSGTGDLGTGSFLPGGEVAPVVPEPSAVLVGFSLLLLAGYRERRWLFRCREARRIRMA